MAPDDNTAAAPATHVEMDLAAIAAWGHALEPTAESAYCARRACAGLGIDYPALVLACQRRNEDLVRGSVDIRLARAEVARALSRAADRLRR